jgi:hypothetical protein
MSKTTTPKSIPHDRALFERGNAWRRDRAVISKFISANGKNTPSFDIGDGGALARVEVNAC